MVTYLVWCFEVGSYAQTEADADHVEAATAQEAAIEWCRRRREHEGYADIAVKDDAGRIRSFDVYQPTGPLMASETTRILGLR